MKVTQGSLASLALEQPVLECMELEYPGLSALAVVCVQLVGNLVQQLVGDLVEQLVGDLVQQLGWECNLCQVKDLVTVL